MYPLGWALTTLKTPVPTVGGTWRKLSFSDALISRVQWPTTPCLHKRTPYLVPTLADSTDMLRPPGILMLSSVFLYQGGFLEGYRKLLQRAFQSYSDLLSDG